VGWWGGGGGIVGVQWRARTSPWIIYHHFMRKMGAAVIIARWWRAKIGPYLYLWHWQGVRRRAAILIQRNVRVYQSQKWFRNWRNERRWAIATLHRFWRYGLQRLAIREMLDLAYLKRMNDRR